MLVSDEAKGEYRWQEENQRSERGAERNTHSRATGGNAESKAPSLETFKTRLDRALSNLI